jgi:hypothetical protein
MGYENIEKKEKNKRNRGRGGVNGIFPAVSGIPRSLSWRSSILWTITLPDIYTTTTVSSGKNGVFVNSL